MLRLWWDSDSLLAIKSILNSLFFFSASFSGGARVASVIISFPCLAEEC